MNIHRSPLASASTTRAAEGFERRAFTVAEIMAMQDLGIIDESENFELIEGEIIPMNAKFHVHERIKAKLNIALARALPDQWLLGVETSIFLGERTFVEPDLCLYPEPMPSDEVRGPDILLAIEVAVSTLKYDMGLKAKIYARYDVRELWVIDAVQRRTFIHTGPQGDSWASITEHGAEFVLTHPALSGFCQRLCDI